jgi:hypothetical protein
VTKVLGRQQRYQQRNRARGLCQQCQAPLWHNKNLCCTCLVVAQLRVGGLVRLKWKPREAPALITLVLGVLAGAEFGTSKPLDSWLDVAVKLNSTFKWRYAEWKDPSSIRFCQWLYKWDRDLRSGKR